MGVDTSIQLFGTGGIDSMCDTARSKTKRLTIDGNRPRTYGSLIVSYVHWERVFQRWKMNGNILSSCEIALACVYPYNRTETERKPRKDGLARKRRRMLWIIKFTSISSIWSHSECLLDMHIQHSHTHRDQLSLFYFSWMIAHAFILRILPSQKMSWAP